MKWLTELAVLTLAIAAGTWFGAWWMVPVVGAVFGAWRAHQRLTLITAALAGALAWALLLAHDAAAGPLDRLMELLGSILRVPGSALVVLSLAFAALLAVSSAALTRGMRRLAESR